MHGWDGATAAAATGGGGGFVEGMRIGTCVGASGVRVRRGGIDIEGECKLVFDVDIHNERLIVILPRIQPSA